MKPYSVLLLYPDYFADNFGQDTFFTHVEALGPKEAVRTAQHEIQTANQQEVDDPTDFYPLLVIEGHHDDVKPGD